jgi:hypothetical protein
MRFKKAGLITLTILLIGLVVAVILTKNQTQTSQQASGNTNLNTGSSILFTKNKDNTEGPVTSKQNYSGAIKKENLGSITVTLTNTSKVSFVKEFVIKIRKIEVYLESSDKAVNKWETLDMPLPISVNLAQLSGGGVANITLTNLSFGKYKEIRLYVENAVLVMNGKTQKLGIEGKDSIIRVNKDFEIAKNKNTNLVLDFNAEKSYIESNQRFLLKPFVSDILVNN